MAERRATRSRVEGIATWGRNRLPLANERSCVPRENSEWTTWRVSATRQPAKQVKLLYVGRRRNALQAPSTTSNCLTVGENVRPCRPLATLRPAHLAKRIPSMVADSIHQHPLAPQNDLEVFRAKSSPTTGLSRARRTYQGERSVCVMLAGLNHQPRCSFPTEIKPTLIGQKYYANHTEDFANVKRGSHTPSASR
jgi:hypothetical protein